MDLRMILENAVGALSAAEDILQGLDVQEGDETLSVIEDIRKSIEDLRGLSDTIYTALAYATYAGHKELEEPDKFGFGADSFEWRDNYLDWADETELSDYDDYYDVLAITFEKKFNEYYGIEDGDDEYCGIEDGDDNE